MSRYRMRIFSKTPEHATATSEDSRWDEETKKCFQLLVQCSINKVKIGIV